MKPYHIVYRALIKSPNKTLCNLKVKNMFTMGRVFHESNHFCQDCYNVLLLTTNSSPVYYVVENYYILPEGYYKVECYIE